MTSKGEAIKQNEELQRRVKIYEMDRSDVRGEKMAEVWKAKFDEMFKVSQKLALENQKLQQELASLRGKKQHQVLGGPKFSSAFSATNG